MRSKGNSEPGEGTTTDLSLTCRNTTQHTQASFKKSPVHTWLKSTERLPPPMTVFPISSQDELVSPQESPSRSCLVYLWLRQTHRKTFTGLRPCHGPSVTMRVPHARGPGCPFQGSVRKPNTVVFQRFSVLLGWIKNSWRAASLQRDWAPFCNSKPSSHLCAVPRSTTGAQDARNVDEVTNLSGAMMKRLSLPALKVGLLSINLARIDGWKCF